MATRPVKPVVLTRSLYGRVSEEMREAIDDAITAGTIVLDDGPDCDARLNASVVCTLESGHTGPHFDIENPTAVWPVTTCPSSCLKEEQ